MLKIGLINGQKLFQLMSVLKTAKLNYCLFIIHNDDDVQNYAVNNNKVQKITIKVYNLKSS